MDTTLNKRTKYLSQNMERPFRLLKERPKYRAIYQIELAEELTGRDRAAIRKMMERKGLNLVEVIKYYLKNETI